MADPLFTVECCHLPPGHDFYYGTSSRANHRELYSFRSSEACLFAFFGSALALTCGLSRSMTCLFPQPALSSGETAYIFLLAVRRAIIVSMRRAKGVRP